MTTKSETNEEEPLIFQVNSFEEAWEIFKVKQDEIKALSKAFVEEDKTAIADVNGKKIIFEGIGYSHPDIKQLLTMAGAPFNPMYVSQPPADGSKVKEYRLSVRHPWGQDRVM